MSAGRMLDRKDFICYHWYMHRIAFGKFTMGYPDAIPRLSARRVRVRTRKENVHPMKMRRLISAIIALLLVVNLSVTAFAAEWYLEDGDITVSAGDSGQTVSQGGGAAVEDNAPVIKGSSTENTVTINAEKDQTANVTLSGVNIDVSGAGKAAVSTTGEGNVNIELNGSNALKSGHSHAGLEKNNDGNLTIQDKDKDGSLNAKGGQDGAGIGGGSSGAGSDITITGGKVTARGGNYGAGIGGGAYGNGSDITVTGGEVTANSGNYGAGIGGGGWGNGNNITISGGKVTATGGMFAAGIGGGMHRDGNDITISGGEVSAAGGRCGAGIGGGLDARSSGDVTVSGDAKLKVRGGKADSDGQGAPIGNGGVRDQNGPVNGTEVEPDICALNSSGKIEYYAPGSFMTGTPIETITNPTGDHAWDSGRVTKPATCTEKGIKTYTCTRHSSHTKNEDIPALNHSFAGQEYVSDNNATCGQDGTKTIRCVRYGRGGCTEKDTVVDTGSMLGHSFDEEAYVFDNNATCEQDGTKTAKCVRYGTGGCTETNTVTDVGSRLGHLFEDYVSDNNATYGRDGTKTAKCVRYDQCGAINTILDVGSRLKKSKLVNPLYRVTDKDGKDIAYTAEHKDGVLTVTVDADFAVLTGKLSGISTLKAQGVEKIVFVTKDATSAFRLADLLEKGAAGETYKLTHDGKTAAFTAGGQQTDISDILVKA